ncbi:MAG: hypothetical protein V3R83_09660 [Gammaproteobacteria bacterium]
MNEMDRQAKLGSLELTERGFQVIEFKDLYGLHCTLQQSSLAHSEKPGGSAVWLGGKDERMHLTCEQVESLIADLQSWLDSGSFDGVDSGHAEP